ncbi:Zn-ribbon domain-containing OB-fold protein [Pseudonocardia broussonetiae]|uniref:DNA-binding protein n=1 Tax=Pseudonocardia broussonetiae TaxID=2736640 RepID=A0A6M6JIY2_9PSEU|nr:OB-fold domain-containing protein [Pseudonocardia broussonetiae]QJY48044.1 DNA-binding protein [Pseudonocardia broussonetiae]
MSSGPVPSPTPETAPFWESTRARAMRLPHCTPCGRPHFYPRSYCPFCHSAELEWREVSGRATLASYVINRRPGPAFEGASQIIALVRLAEGPRMMTNLVEVETDPVSLRLGMPLRVRYSERGDQVLPLFAPAEVAA